MEMFLKLGKEISREVLSRHKDSYFAYVDVEYMKDETLINIGKTVMSRKDKFEDYMRYKSGEEGFDWSESSVNSYDFIEDVVSDNLNTCTEFMWNGEEESYMRVAYPDEINSCKDIVRVTAQISLNNPIMFLLDDKGCNYIVLKEIKRENLYELYVSGSMLDSSKYCSYYDVEDYKNNKLLLLAEAVGQIEDIVKDYKELI